MGGRGDRGRNNRVRGRNNDTNRMSGAVTDSNNQGDHSRMGERNNYPTWSQGRSGHYRNSSLEFGPGLKGILGFTNGNKKDSILELYICIDKYSFLEKEDGGKANINGCKVNPFKPPIDDVSLPLKDSEVIAKDTEISGNEKDSGHQLIDDSKKEILGEDTDEFQDQKEGAPCDYADYLTKKLGVEHPRNRTYISLMTYVSNIVFINSNRDNPASLVQKIYEDMVATEESPFYTLHKFLPVTITCSNSSEDILATLRKILPGYIAKQGYISFSVEYDSFDSKTKFNRDEMNTLLLNCVLGINPDAYISFYQPSYLILVLIVGHVTCISVLTQAGKYHHYNCGHNEFRIERNLL